ncbi:glycogen debranching protein [Knoellia flava TL1]|uniref:Glycogen operon protein GlgX homolog n=2 Tax=Knoellia flava TaxID=913969 RepID=A0A8H9FV82_9MICO|nr:glycogen debranching protein GlgX [Knoellia flava]KGN28749.1 glycogen debranching protein [Knoellia flava TL1]GGB85177.1 glycogen operon protein GlgX homolog [Knoellia flava]
MTPVTSAAAAPSLRVAPDLPPAPGVTLHDGGIEVCVYAGHADSVELCLFDTGDSEGASERRVPLVDHAHGWWFGFVPDVGVGQRYGFRVGGAWDPEQGMRHNPAQLLMDPYARAIEGEVRWGPSVFGHVVDDEEWRGDGTAPSDTDSAPDMPRSVVVDPSFDWGDDVPPATTRSETVIYETHVVNLTKTLPGVPEELRGTYAGLAHPATVEYLVGLGVTAIELLPVHAFASEPFLVRKGLANHWGYNTLGFFAPHAPYAAATDPQGVVDEFKGMVKLLHAAGLEVLLDVVYNHTAEADGTGPTLSFRGLDNRAYYRLDERGRDIDVTGTGNTLDLRHPVMCRLALDSLRYWVQECHVDGFRFDLAVALGRGRTDEFDPDHPFLVGMRTDPVLSRTKLIVEPWDVGMHGWRTGQFPPPFSEWNDRFRDSVRDFWLGDHRSSGPGQVAHGVQDLATRLAGSRDLFGTRDRGPTASVNFVAAHDGFTLADLTAYDEKHNEANGEENRDGSNGNRSWNHGVEGPTDDEDLLALRRRSMRNLLGTLLLSSGIPMINAGDELGRSQGGNNNPYNQDNPTTWFDWDLEPWQEDLLATTKHLIAIRREHPALRQRTWAEGKEVHADGSIDLAWYAADGEAMRDWSAPGQRTLQMLVNGAWLGHESVLVVLHGGREEQPVVLPKAPGLSAYRLLWDSVWKRPEHTEPTPAGEEVAMAPLSMRVYAVTDPT